MSSDMKPVALEVAKSFPDLPLGRLVEHEGSKVLAWVLKEEPAGVRRGQLAAERPKVWVMTLKGQRVWWYADRVRDVKA